MLLLSQTGIELFCQLGFRLDPAEKSVTMHSQCDRSLQAKKDPTLRTLEARLRNARYVGELVKFRLAPFGTIFVMLKVRADLFMTAHMC